MSATTSAPARMPGLIWMAAIGTALASAVTIGAAVFLPPQVLLPQVLWHDMPAASRQPAAAPPPAAAALPGLSAALADDDRTLLVAQLRAIVGQLDAIRDTAPVSDIRDRLAALADAQAHSAAVAAPLAQALAVVVDHLDTTVSTLKASPSPRAAPLAGIPAERLLLGGAVLALLAAVLAIAARPLADAALHSVASGIALPETVVRLYAAAATLDRVAAASLQLPETMARIEAAAVAFDAGAAGATAASQKLADASALSAEACAALPQAVARAEVAVAALQSAAAAGREGWRAPASAAGFTDMPSAL
jgi:hypothetical protein